MSRVTRFLLTLAFLGLSACDDGGNSDSRLGQPPSVVRLDLGDPIVAVGDGTVLFTDISFDLSDVFNFGDDIIMVVKLPSGIAYRNGTSELDGGNQSDTTIFPRVTECANGDSFVEFDLTANALNTAAAPSNDAEARVKFTIDAVSRIGTAQILARASRNFLTFGCDESFPSDEAIAITIR